MKTLRETLEEARAGKRAVGHFNIADLAALKGIFGAAKDLDLPVVIGLSEGERDFVGVRQAAALVKSLREERDFPIYLNADHTHSIERIKAAVDAGFDAVLFDGGKLPLEENIERTKEVVAYARAAGRDIVVEGELGYIGSSSEVFTELPAGAAIRPEDLTKPDDAKRFVEATGIDLLAPAVGNVHGMFANAANPRLSIDTIRAIAGAVPAGLVLHGGSGTTDDDFTQAIAAGVVIVHISTELRRAWRAGVERGLAEHPGELAPYKILPDAVAEVAEVVKKRLALFAGR
jgi:fructose-bisphosphate aldolase class II